MAKESRTKRGAEKRAAVAPATPVAAPKISVSGQTDIYFNGRFIGTTNRAEEFTNEIRRKRRAGILPHELNIFHNPAADEINILTEHGRVRRPLIIVENGRPRLTDVHMKQLKSGKAGIDYLIKHGIIEYVDAAEEENLYIAMRPEDLTKEHTHMEINPITMLGISSTFIPYPEYNRGDRINYGAKMIGQAIGLMSDNFLIRMDTKFNNIVYSQKPLVQAGTSLIINEYPEGHNVVVAVMCYDGYNLNDAIVMNRSSVERGMFRSFYFRTYETIKKRYWGGQEDEITVPEPGIKGHLGEEAYVDLDSDGIINPETPVKSDSVIIGKVSPLRFLSDKGFTSDIENRRETSVTIRHGEEGTADEILITETTDAEQLIKVRIRELMVPELGDKFASRHGQKGVVSILVPQEDMPFTADGVIPDLIFNPHAIPSRMTVGQLIELISGKVGAFTGRTVDASAFNHVKEDEIRKSMKAMGFRDDGKQTLYDGRTGKKYDVMIFTGLSYYLKLDHMVANKIHARSRGPVTLLTKQPTEGRAKRGGLRIGEMEQQCILGHGAALTLKERFDSDKAFIPICDKCGLIAIYDSIRGRGQCPVCKDSKIVWVETSYAFKLTLDEIKSMNIYPRITTEEI